MAKKKPAQPIDLNDVLTSEEAAQVIGVSGRRVRELLKSGELPGRPVNERLWLVTRASAESFQRKPRGRPKKEQS